MPALTAIVPVTVLDPLSVSWPAPVLLNPCVPATTALIMLVALLTAMVGVPLLMARVSGPPVPVLRVQLRFTPGFKSSNTMVPMVRAPSRVTVRFALKLSVLKSAAASAPPAMLPPLQFPEAPQEPPLAFIHTPEPGGAVIRSMAGALVTLLAMTV